MEGTTKSSFSRVCCRRNYLGRTGATKPESIYHSQVGLGMSTKITNQSKMGDKYIQNIKISTECTLAAKC